MVSVKPTNKTNVCDENSCKRVRFQANDKCVLHCKKHDYSTDSHNFVLRQFYDELLKYIANNMLEYKSSLPMNVDFDSIVEYLKLGHGANEVVDFCKSETIVFTSIFFPCHDDRDSFNYIPVLEKVGGIHFNYCKFTETSIDLPDVEVFYQDCEFFQYWSIYNSKILENVDSIIYQACTFNENVYITSSYGKNRIVDNSIFRDCIFKGKLEIRGIQFKSSIFNNTPEIELKINFIEIDKCIFDEKFILNNLTSMSLRIIDTEFQSKIELKNNNIDEIEINNSNFHGLFDAYDSSFGTFTCFKSIFKDFVGFEMCKFSVNENNNEAIFKYTTFLSFTSFRDSIFHNGLDLEKSNLKEQPNFLNIQLHSSNTNRETLRIIKHSFDKIGNHIDANKFFVKEMMRYKQDLFKNKSITQEKLVFLFNEKVSNFGQSYWKPFYLFLGTIAIYSLLICGHEANILYKLMPSLNNVFSNISAFFNYPAKNIITYSKFLRPGMEFLSLIFYIIFAVLTWQIIVAVKRHTKQ